VKTLIALSNGVKIFEGANCQNLVVRVPAKNILVSV